MNVDPVEKIFKHESRGSREVVLSRQIEELGNFIAAANKSARRRAIALFVLVALDVALQLASRWL